MIGGGELDGAGLAALSAFTEQPAHGISKYDGGGDGADEAGAAGEEAAADGAAIEEAFGEAHFIDDFGVVGEAFFGVVAEHAIDDVLGAGGEAEAGFAEGDALGFDAAEVFDGIGVGFVGRIAGHRMVERGAEGEDVAAVVFFVVDDFFGGDVEGGGPDFAGLIAAAIDEEGEAEVHDFGGAGFGEEDVGGFDVAMDEGELLGGAEAFGDFAADAEGFGFFEVAFAADALLEGAAADELHGDVEVALVVADGVELDDVGVGDVGGDVGLAAELLEAGGVAGVLAVEDFEGDAAAEGFVFGLEDAAHAAFADLADDHELVKTATDADHLAAEGALELGEGLQGGDIDLALTHRAGAQERLFWRGENQRERVWILAGRIEDARNYSLPY